MEHGSEIIGQKFNSDHLPIFEDENITSVNAVGIAFSGKNCFISYKKIK